ncbi:Nlrc4p [Mactra antiquata]
MEFNNTAEMNQQSGQVRIVGRDKEKEMLARLAWLLLDAGTAALRVTFDSIHPPLNLRDHLSQPHVKSVLQRLSQQAILNDKQWQLLYPVKKKHTSSQKYDSRTLIILLETICHLCPPYPHGWGKDPLPTDGSLSADIVRLQLLFIDMARHEAIAGESYIPWFVQIRDVIVRLGGPPIRIKITRIESELINLDMQQHYIKTLRETWQADVIQKLEKVHEFRTKTSKKRKAYSDSKGIEEGLSAEDRVTLKKTYKLIVENVNAEDVIDRLQQSQVIKFSDRQDILSISKKQERMQVLLEKISDSKLPYSLKALFDAMKFKYKKLYEHCMAVRKQTYKEGVVMTIDVSGITHDALVTHYKNAFSRVYPFPWSDTIYASVRDIYTSLDIIDNDGNKIPSIELIPTPCTNGRGQRILLEGGAGSGKSVFCAWLSYMWATHPGSFKNSFKQLIYLDMSSLKGNLENAVYKSLFPDNFKVSVNEFWNMLEKRANEVLLIVDEYDKCPDVDISDILDGTRLKGSTVIVAANPDHLSGNVFVPDTKWFNLGFSELNIRRCFRNYVSLSKLEHDQFEKLYHLAGKESWPLRLHLVNPALAVKAFGVYSVLRKSTMLKEMETICDLLDKYGAAMATLYCRKQKIDIIGFEFPDEVLRAIEKLDIFAYSCVMAGKSTFTEEDVLNSTEDSIVLKFGAFSKFTQSSKLKFSSGIAADFLAARHIADMVYEDMETTILKRKMIKLPKYTQLMSFLCGQYRDDTDTSILNALFDHIAARNEYCVRGLHFPTPSMSTPEGSEGKTKIPRGVLPDFVTSLQCLSECPKRQEMAETIAQTLPQRLLIKTDGMLARKTVQGLCLAFDQSDCAVQELELELHQYHHFQLPLFQQLAYHIGKNSNVHSMKITWSSVDIMSKFLAKVMDTSTSIETVVLKEDDTRKPMSVKQISAATWAALQLAITRMNSVCQLSFLNGRTAAILNHVLQYMPRTIQNVRLNGCTFNLMCAGQVANILHGNTAIRSLDLSHTNLNSSEFVAIFQGMQMCDGIQNVRVRGVRLDRPCIIALSEYIKLTHSLQVLDLSECELNTEMCSRLVTSIKQNRTLLKLIFNDARITVEGRKVISKTKSKVQHVNVEGLVPIYG